MNSNEKYDYNKMIIFMRNIMGIMIRMMKIIMKFL